MTSCSKAFQRQSEWWFERWRHRISADRGLGHPPDCLEGMEGFTHRYRDRIHEIYDLIHNLNHNLMTRRWSKVRGWKAVKIIILHQERIDSETRWGWGWWTECTEKGWMASCLMTRFHSAVTVSWSWVNQWCVHDQVTGSYSCWFLVANTRHPLVETCQTIQLIKPNQQPWFTSLDLMATI